MRPVTSNEILDLADRVGKDIANTRSYEMREWMIIEDSLRALFTGTKGARQIDPSVAALIKTIQTRLLGVRHDEQDVRLDDDDWRLILAALGAPALPVQRELSSEVTS